MIHWQLAWFQVCLLHHEEIDSESLVSPQGQEEHPPGQLPPQVEEPKVELVARAMLKHTQTKRKITLANMINIPI